jgi:hypothetical protein
MSIRSCSPAGSPAPWSGDSFQFHMDLQDLAPKGEGAALSVDERYRRAEVDPHIEGLVRGEGGRHGALDRRVGDLLAVHLEDNFGGGTGLGDCRVDKKVSDSGITTSRRPKDIPETDVFIKKVSASFLGPQPYPVMTEPAATNQATRLAITNAPR